MKAYVFPGQGAQFVGMGKNLYDGNEECRAMFEKANEIIGFRITDLMFAGTPEDLKQTKVTQPAIFLHSVILAKYMGDAFKPDMVGGHSLGEFSALVAAGAMSFEDGLRLVIARANAMQKCCEKTPSTMAAVLKLDDKTVEDICASVEGEVVVPANYNCPGQLVWPKPSSVLSSTSRYAPATRTWTPCRTAIPLRLSATCSCSSPRRCAGLPPCRICSATAPMSLLR